MSDWSLRLFQSVRGRLLLLCFGLLLLLGGANLLLARIIGERESQELAQAEQYGRVQTVVSVREAFGAVRHFQSLANVGRLTQDPSLQKRVAESLAGAERQLQDSLAEMAEFDATVVALMRRERELSVEAMRKAVEAIALKSSDSATLAGAAIGHLDRIEQALAEAGVRERRLAQEVTAQQLEGARTGVRLALTIVVLATLAGLALSAAMLHALVRPLQQTVAALRQINDGQSMVDLPPITGDEFGEMAQALRQFRDQADQLRELAYTDAATGLGNRARMDQALRQAVARSAGSGATLALLAIDLDNFGGINDGLGYTAGDAYLREAGQRLARFAPEDALVCRYSGDKFAVLIETESRDEPEHDLVHLRRHAELILRGMSESFAYREHLLPMSVSIGIALFPQHASSESELISGADAAMYLVKQDGRNGIRFADRGLSVGARQDLAMVAELRRGIEQKEFEAHYQPIIDTLAGKVAGAEALLRWQHPQRGLLTADRFIPAAEASGQIQELGQACLQQVCEQLVEWQAGDGAALWLSVNLSVRQIEHGPLLEQLEQLLRRPGFSPASLLLEITESAALDRVDKARETLDRIRRMGFQLGMDDFGTGYSSMVYLQRFPVDKIKIDRLFVQRMDTSREAHAIVSAVIAIARSLQLQVVAEGVETAAQSQQLRDMGCHLQQGFLFARALPAAEFARWRTGYEAAAGG